MFIYKNLADDMKQHLTYIDSYRAVHACLN